MRALEEQSDAIKGAAEGMMAAINTFLRTAWNLKRVIEMTRRAMVLAHGDRVKGRREGGGKKGSGAC